MVSIAKTKQSATAASIYLSKVYLWMFIGLLCTAAAAFVCAASPNIMEYIESVPVMLGLIIVELLIVVGLTRCINSFSASLATAALILFAVVNGMALSSICLIYTGASLAATFFITAGMFGAMSVYGLVTKRDLSGLGSFLFMGLIGLIIGTIVNLFLGSGVVGFVLSVVGVVIFTLYTAFDTQKILRLGQEAPLDDSDTLQRGAVLGALTLYLDFINLFLYLLHFFGQTRD